MTLIRKPKTAKAKIAPKLPNLKDGRGFKLQARATLLPELYALGEHPGFDDTTGCASPPPWWRDSRESWRNAWLLEHCARDGGTVEVALGEWNSCAVMPARAKTPDSSIRDVYESMAAVIDNSSLTNTFRWSDIPEEVLVSLELRLVEMIHHLRKANKFADPFTGTFGGSTTPLEVWPADRGSWRDGWIKEFRRRTGESPGAAEEAWDDEDAMPPDPDANLTPCQPFPEPRSEGFTPNEPGYYFWIDLKSLTSTLPDVMLDGGLIEVTRVGPESITFRTKGVVQETTVKSLKSDYLWFGPNKSPLI